MPVDDTGSAPPEFLGDLVVVAGSPALALRTSEHGLALEISSEGFVRVEWMESWPKASGIRYMNLSMTEGSAHYTYEGQVRSWISSDSDSVRIHLFHESIHGLMHRPGFPSGGGPEYSLWIYPAGDGWQRADVDHGWIVIN